ncbi:hypothetical protein RF11_16035 [Thelohanellus kitauei]|uniref:Uncharacterized protein n=1 Tax=Thelohanellus kitauei TaxID=669202 RepID=A0A0C2MY75_THEKT|nr:hypothetical protein RF11_16035 [Thelohanellus kitauei]
MLCMRIHEYLIALELQDYEKVAFVGISVDSQDCTLIKNFTCPDGINMPITNEKNTLKIQPPRSERLKAKRILRSKEGKTAIISDTFYDKSFQSEILLNEGSEKDIELSFIDITVLQDIFSTKL